MKTSSSTVVNVTPLTLIGHRWFAGVTKVVIHSMERLSNHRPLVVLYVRKVPAR